jgi:hypothetical protein
MEWRRSYVVKAAAVGLVAFGALAGTATSAEAQARLNFEGSARVSDEPGSMGENLLIDFLVAGSTAGTPTGDVVAIETISGEFVPEITPGTVGVIQDLVINSSGVVGSAAGDPTPIDNFLTIGGYTFSLNDAADGNAFGPISLFDIGTGTLASFGIFGTVTGPDYVTPRNYLGAFTAQFAGQTPAAVFNAINTGGTLPVSFSAEFVVGSVVPEPSTYILLATGLGALGLVGLRRRATQA